jgi:amidase
MFVLGYAGWIGEYAEEDCVLAEILNECGANIFVRTNVPQTLIASVSHDWSRLTSKYLRFQWGETYNHVFGRTTNPHNRRCTPGGSSGGEGALLALKGSPLGVGTDIGGFVL